jgi:hypothetical protein
MDFERPSRPCDVKPQAESIWAVIRMEGGRRRFWLRGNPVSWKGFCCSLILSILHNDRMNCDRRISPVSKLLRCSCMARVMDSPPLPKWKRL